MMLTDADYRIMYQAQEADLKSLRAQLAAETARRERAEELASFNVNSGHATAVELQDELTELAADNERLRGALKSIGAIDIDGESLTWPVIDQVIRTALAATSAQSLARVKSETLREAAGEYLAKCGRSDIDQSTCWGEIWRQLRDKADRLAKEASTKC